MYCSTLLILQLYHSHSENPRDILAPDSLTNTPVTRSVINDEQGVALLIGPLCLKQPVIIIYLIMTNLSVFFSLKKIKCFCLNSTKVTLLFRSN